MKRKAMAVTAALVLGLSACGGSDSGTGGDGGTVTTSNAQAVGTTAKMLTGSVSLIPQLFAAMMTAPVAQVIKADGTPTISCTQPSAGQYNCTITDSYGGTVVFTGTADPTAGTFEFDGTFSNFKPEVGTTIDGQIRWTAAVNPSAFAGYASASPSTGKAAADECDYTEENITGNTYCQESTQSCTASSANRIMNITMVVGSSGLTYTDICGTFTYGASTTASMDWCSDNLESMVVLFTMSLNGVFNGTAINETVSVSCDLSSATSAS